MGEDESVGGRSPETSENDILEVFLHRDATVLKTNEIADDVSIGPRQVLNRLSKLEKKGRVGSRTVSGQGKTRLWWHGNLSLWSSTGAENDEIGVEVIDQLDLPGHGKTLRQRRQAVSSVFKYLFENEVAVASKLQLIGWGADPDSYSTAESLWNNCLKKALDQSPLFRLFKTEKEWRLTEAAAWLKRHDNRALWDDWSTHRTKLVRRCHTLFWWAILDKEVKIPSRNRSQKSHVVLDVPNSDHHLELVLDLDEPLCGDATGILYHSLALQSPSEGLRNDTSGVESQLDFDITWRDHIDENGLLALTRSRSVEVGASELFKNHQEGEMSTRLTEIQSWSFSTQNQMIDLAQNLAGPS